MLSHLPKVPQPTKQALELGSMDFRARVLSTALLPPLPCSPPQSPLCGPEKNFTGEWGSALASPLAQQRKMLERRGWVLPRPMGPYLSGGCQQLPRRSVKPSPQGLLTLTLGLLTPKVCHSRCPQSSPIGSLSLLSPRKPAFHSSSGNEGELTKPPRTSEDLNARLFPKGNGELQKDVGQGETG